MFANMLHRHTRPSSRALPAAPSPTAPASAGLAESSALGSFVFSPTGWWQCDCVCFHIPEQAGATLTSTLPPPRPETRMTGWAAAAGAQGQARGGGLPCTRPAETQGPVVPEGPPPTSQGPASLYLWHPAGGLWPGSLAGRGQAPAPPPRRGPGPSGTSVPSGQRRPVLN